MNAEIITTLMPWLIAIALLLTLVGFYLGQRKTGKPVITGLSLGVSVFVPIVAVVYLVYLLTKPDVSPGKG